MKILITGITGFVGTNLKSYLEANGMHTAGVSRENIAGFIGYESLTPELLNNLEITAVVHLAGKAHDTNKGVTEDVYLEANTELTKKVYDVFLASAASVFIYMSSVKAVTDHTGETVTEETPAAPKTFYGISKKKAEEYIIQHSVPHKKYFILRPCMIHGPGNKGNLNLLYAMAAKGIPFPLGAFTNLRSFLGIENLCFVIKQLVSRNEIPGGIYQVADNQPLSTNQVIKIIGDELKTKPKIWNINTGIIRFIARMGNVLPLPLNTERLEKLTENFVVSNNRIINAMQMPLPVSAETGLRKTISSFIKNK